VEPVVADDADADSARPVEERLGGEGGCGVHAQTIGALADRTVSVRGAYRQNSVGNGGLDML
jgi:hypothetical protein